MLAILSRAAILYFFIPWVACSSDFGQAATLSLSSDAASPGNSVTLNLSLNATTVQPASLEWALNYSITDFTSAAVAAGPAATNKSVTCNSGSGTLTCLVWALDNTAIANGVVATVTVTLSPSTTSMSSSV